jgi:hypothetical protein
MATALMELAPAEDDAAEEDDYSLDVRVVVATHPNGKLMARGSGPPCRP